MDGRSRRLLVLLVVAAFVGCHGAATPTVATTSRTAGAPIDQLAMASSACARIASCSHPHDPLRERDASACVDWWVAHEVGLEPEYGLEPDEALVCLGAAIGCRGVDRCLRGGGDARAVAFCTSHPGTQTVCVGSERIACGEDDASESSRTDCAAFGAACAETRSQGGLVGYACVDPIRCPPESSRARCDGPRAVVSCHDGSIDRAPCSGRTTCHEHRHEDGAEFATCGGAGEECDVVGSRRCEADVLVECEAHGHAGRVRTTHCAPLGLSCVEANGSASCAARPPECAPGAARCEGDALVFCAAGRKARVSCAGLGMGRCDPDAHGLEAACKVANDGGVR